MRPFRSVGGRLALALTLVVAGVLAIVYLIVVPSYRTSLENNELNTLGVVYYRVGEMTKAIETLQASIKADTAGGNAHDFLFLAMAYYRLGNPKRAEEYFSKATNWAETHTDIPASWKEELKSFRAEAEGVLGKSK